MTHIAPLLTVIFTSSSLLLTWSPAGASLSCASITVLDNTDVIYTFLRSDPLRLYSSSWTGQRALLGCAWSDDAALIQKYSSRCRQRTHEFTDHPNENYDVDSMFEREDLCVSAGDAWSRERTGERSAAAGSLPENHQGRAERSEVRRLQRVKRGFIVPGTLWCGSGNKAPSYEDLGVFAETDSCCREHDQCKHTILSFDSQFGVFNSNIFTMSHCDCDKKFHSCLTEAKDSISDVVGYTFFNLLQMHCFEFSHRLQCTQRNWFGMCKETKLALYAEVHPPTLYDSPSPTEVSINSSFINTTSSTSRPAAASTVPPPSTSTVPPSSNSTSTVPPPSNSTSTVPPSSNSTATVPLSSNSTATVPPPSNSTSTVPPPSNSTSTVPPSSNSTATVPLSSNSTATVPPPSNSTSTVPPPSNSTSTVPPPSTSTSTVPPPSNSTSTVPPSSNSTATVPLSSNSTATVPPPSNSTSTVPPPSNSTSTVPPPSISTSTVPPSSTSTVPPSSTSTSTVPPPSTTTSTVPPPSTTTSTVPPPSTSTSTVTNTTEGPAGPGPGPGPESRDNLENMLSVREQDAAETQLSCDVYKDLDECKNKILPQQTRYGLQNQEATTLYHCNCTTRLLQTLAKQRQLTDVQARLLGHVSPSCFLLQDCTAGSSCTAVVVQAELPQVDQRSGADVEEQRHLQAVRLKVRRPNTRRAKRKDGAVRLLHRLCVRMVHRQLNKSRKPAARRPAGRRRQLE
ncbi:group 3 secretory phospholipase A2 isoform X2 [Pagrus major]|uniref:group 3 secretory phospholipase A2 isoform X2 n=1 Tax=Pagrus major TaxID=143350 RepID=UPI003CC844A6